jgi:hypothetical protein
LDGALRCTGVHPLGVGAVVDHRGSIDQGERRGRWRLFRSTGRGGCNRSGRGGGRRAIRAGDPRHSSPKPHRSEPATRGATHGSSLARPCRQRGV